MLYRIWSLVLISFIISTSGVGQQFGGTSPGIKWLQVNSQAARVIFPKGLDSTATRISNVISWLDQKTKGTIGNRTRKVNVVLQNQTTISNAYVALGPFRSEFFLTPTQNSFEIGSLPWPDQLAIHEYRHVQQYNNFDVGIAKLLRILFGEDGQALANGASIPNWFFEGDAVYNETNVSSQGRGRLPFFYDPYRSLWAEGKNYNWLKLRNGSLRDFTPDHYALGYLLVAYGREKYGDEFWKKVTQDAAAFKGIFYPFQTAVKKYSGKSYVQFRQDALNYYKEYFADKYPTPKTKRHEYINEEFPVRINASDILFVRSGYKKPPAFVLKTSQGERIIRTRDISLDNQYSYRNGNIVYATYRPDIRWRYKDYSDLRILNIATGAEQTLTNKTKYFSPDINEEGTKVVAVNVKSDGSSALNILSVPGGKILSVLPNADHLFYTYPKFFSENIIISAVRDTLGKMSLLMNDLTTNTSNYLTPFSFDVIGFPFVSHDTIYYISSYMEKDRLFAYTLADKKLYIISGISGERGIGSYYPSSFNGSISWSTFTAEGFKMHEENLSSMRWTPVKEASLDQPTKAFGISTINKTNADELSSVPRQKLIVSKYHKSTGLLNFHSIQPNVNDPEYTLHLLGENILNTLESDLAFTYNRSEQWKRISFKTIYGGLFPYISGNIDYTFDRRGRYHGKTIYFNELEPGGGLSVALDLGKNRSIRRLTVSSIYTYNQTDFQGPYKDSLGRRSFSYLNNFINFTNQLQRSKQQIFPSFAQNISFSYKRALTHYKASQITGVATFYIPGLFKNHSLAVNAAFLQKDTVGQLNFSSNFPFSRGYTSINLYQMFKLGVTYHLPLVYPDAGIANIVYLLRVRGNVFYDYTRANDFYSDGSKFMADFRSTGTEIYLDTKWWNDFPVTLGIRYSRLLNTDIFGNNANRNRWEFILPVNLFNQ